jgi:hypothetical protein
MPLAYRFDKGCPFCADGGRIRRVFYIASSKYLTIKSLQCRANAILTVWDIGILAGGDGLLN